MSKRENWLIRTQNLRKAYKTPAGEVHALQGVDLQVAEGEFVMLWGKSGAGKSTLINMLTGIDKPSDGEIWIDAHGVHAMGEDEAARWRGAQLGVVFQSFQLLPMLTCAQNVMLPMDLAGRHGRPADQYTRAMDLLDRVGIAEHADKLPSAVSGGQRQRVAIARAMANKPDLIVADEPTGSLDSKTAANVFTLFEQLVADGTTVLVATHDPELAARGSRKVEIADGRIISPPLSGKKTVTISAESAACTA